MTVLAREPWAADLARRLWRDLPGLLGANLIFLAWCAPAALLAMLRLPHLALLVAPLTLGPGLAGLMAYAARVARGEPGRLWQDGVGGTRGRFVASAAHATVVLRAWRAGALAFAVADHEAGWGAVTMWAGQVSVLAGLAMVEVHVFGLIALYRQGVVPATRNAVVLAARYPDATAALVGLGVAAGGLCWTLAGGPLVILPAALAVCAVHTTLTLVEREVSRTATPHRR